MLIIYKIVMNLIYILAYPYFVIKRKKAPEEWNQRCAINTENYLPDKNQLANGEKLIWLHASSVGEVRVLERLIKAIKKEQPQFKYCVSTYTRTGQALAGKLFTDAFGIFFFPLDACYPLNRFFAKFRPDGIVIVETEIWPYLLSHCKRANIPIILANGRLSEKSSKQYRLFQNALSSVFGIYRKFLMQTSDDAERIKAIGADPADVVIFGNIKHDYDDTIDRDYLRAEIRNQLGIDDETTFFIAASTRQGEETVICEAFNTITQSKNSIKLMIAPRHLERLEEVKSILDSNHLKYKLYSEYLKDNRTGDNILLMDEMGLLGKLIYGADITFVGGTLAALGGHNVMEPVLAGAPVIFGPSLYNVKDAANNIVENNWGAIVKNCDDISRVTIELINGRIRFSRFSKSKVSIAEKTARTIIEEFGL